MPSYSTEPAKSIDGHARTVRELLDKSKYAIDFYQREYAWQERQVRELINDLTGKFLDYFTPEHARHEVEHYGHYFLGSVVLSHKRGQRFVVDGQQRLTTLTLLLIYLHNLEAKHEQQVDVRDLIYSEKYGRKSFNLDIPERAEVMRSLLDGQTPDLMQASESVLNIAARYADIVEHFPDDLVGPPLPYFIDWLLENVHFVAIEAYSDEDAYTIFETMNDRGLSLSLPEMLKGYVLANIGHETDQRMVNDVWKTQIQQLKAIGEEEDVDFFKDWLRAQHAQTIRPGKKGAENKDYERIGSEFHRWVRDQKDRLGLWLFAYELIISEKNCVIMEGLFLFLMLKYFYFFRSYYFQLFSCDKLSNLSEFVRYCAMTRFTVAKPISGASEVICAGESIEVNLVPCPLKILI